MLCDKCGFEYKGRKELKKHKKNQHRLDDKECDQILPSISAFQKNIVKNKEINDEMYCEQCNFKTKTRDSLEKHIAKNHHYNCLWCNFLAYSEKEILKHAKVHEEFDESKIFECEECEYTAVTRSILRRHIGLNHRHKCDRCDVISISEDDLKEHVKRVHRGDKLNRLKSRIYCFYLNNDICNRFCDQLLDRFRDLLRVQL